MTGNAGALARKVKFMLNAGGGAGVPSIEETEVPKNQPDPRAINRMDLII